LYKILLKSIASIVGKVFGIGNPPKHHTKKEKKEEKSQKNFGF
jgi:hypothetical protein